MQEILKRLELIKAAIALEDEEVIEPQAMKLSKLNIDDDVKKILDKLDKLDYVSTEAEINNYITKFSGVAVYEDTEIQGLRLVLKVLEEKLQSQNETKIEYLNDIDEFSILYHLRLGNVIQKILGLKDEFLQKVLHKKMEKLEKEKKKFQDLKKEHEKIKKQKDDLEEKLGEIDEFDDAYDAIYVELKVVKEKLEEKVEKLNEQRKKTKSAKEELEDDPLYEQYQEAKSDYEEFCYGYEETKEEDRDRFVISDEEKKELKNLFRKASRLCHPDIVSDELKEQAYEIMSELNNAYKMKDLNRVKEILQALESGPKFDVVSNSINDKDIFKSKIVEFGKKIDDIQSEIDEIMEDDLLRIVNEGDGVDEYLDGLKEELDQEYESLKNTISSAEESKKTDTSLALTSHQKEVVDEITTEIEDIIVSENVDNDVMMTLSGSAGVGKTFVTARIIKKILDFSNDITITAPTHKALLVVRGMIYNSKINSRHIKTQTLHSFLKVKLETNYKTGARKFVVDANEKEKCATKILIVDESSMVGGDLFAYIDQAVTEGRVKAVLFVGDPYQLPPVNSEKTTVFSLQKHYELTEIVRQAENSYIIKIASKIRDCIKNKNFSFRIEEFFTDEYDGLEIFRNRDDFLSEFFSSKEKNWSMKNQIIADYTNKSVNYYNSIVRQRFWKEKGIDNPEQLREGDTVVFQEANVGDDKIIHANSSMATIRKSFKKFDEEHKIWYWHCIDEENLGFKVIDEESSLAFEELMAEKVREAKSETVGIKIRDKWGEYYHLKDKYVDVKYIYSSTIHKLQGSTYDTVFIDLGHLTYLYDNGKEDKEFLYRLLYVAVARASTNIKILL